MENNRVWKNKYRAVESLMGGSWSTEAFRVVRRMKSENEKVIIYHFIDMKTWHSYYQSLIIEYRSEFLGQADNIQPMKQNRSKLGITEQKLRQCILNVSMLVIRW